MYSPAKAPPSRTALAFYTRKQNRRETLVEQKRAKHDAINNLFVSARLKVLSQGVYL